MVKRLGVLRRGRASEFNNRDCSTSGALVGGVQIGENFQFKRLLLGVGADVDYWSAKGLNQSLKYPGAVPPSGTYAFSGKLSPLGSPSSVPESVTREIHGCPT
jgi:hypothetical protein